MPHQDLADSFPTSISCRRCTIPEGSKFICDMDIAIIAPEDPWILSEYCQPEPETGLASVTCLFDSFGLLDGFHIMKQESASADFPQRIIDYFVYIKSVHLTEQNILFHERNFQDFPFFKDCIRAEGIDLVPNKTIRTGAAYQQNGQNIIHYNPTLPDPFKRYIIGSLWAKITFHGSNIEKARSRYAEIISMNCLLPRGFIFELLTTTGYSRALQQMKSIIDAKKELDPKKVEHFCLKRIAAFFQLSQIYIDFKRLDALDLLPRGLVKIHNSFHIMEEWLDKSPLKSIVD